MQIPDALQNAVDELSKLPGIGKKTAFRLALSILKSEEEKVKSLTSSIEGLKSKLHLCKTCFNLAEDDECDICKSNKRDKSTLCVVEEVSDVIAIEKTNEYSGVYHVLGGVLNPLMGVTPDSLKITELMMRLTDTPVKEVILALNPDTEGETTSLYLAKRIKALDIKVSRIARGLPIGGDLEFADEATIGRAVLGRIVI